MIADQRVMEAVSRITGIPVAELKGRLTPDLCLPLSADSLDAIELVMELENEFDEETIRWALRYIEVFAERPNTRRSQGSSRPQSGGSDPLWDRELDGR
jgi:acyl carrier protein